MRAHLTAFRDASTDESLRFAILAGLATVPATVALSWERIVTPPATESVSVGGSASGLALLLAGLVVGYRYSDRPTESRRAGLWTGLAGSLGTGFVFLATTFAPLWSGSGRLSAVGMVLVPVAVALGVGLTVFLTLVSALLADFVASRVRHAGRTTEAAGSEDLSSSDRWKPLLAYVLVVPAVLLAVGWTLVADSDVVFILAGLGFVAVLFLSVYTLYVLFAAATEPRPRTAEWVPRWWLYAGTPLAAAVVVYLARSETGSTYPPGEATYAFVVALWIAAVAYLVEHRRHAEGT